MAYRKAAGLQQIGSILAEVHPELIVSKRRLRKVESIECVRLKRDDARQNLAFSSRPIVLCGLPVRRPPEGSLLHERRNGQFILQVTGHLSYGLPWGQDRLVPIFLATQAIRQKSPQIMFESGSRDAEHLRTAAGRFAVPAPGRVVPENLRRDHLFRHGLSVGAGSGRSSCAIQFHDGSSNLVFSLSRAKGAAGRLPERDRSERGVLPRGSGPSDSDRPGGRQSALVVTSGARSVHVAFPPMLHSPRKGTRAAVRRFGLVSQLGSIEYARPRKFREKLEGWLNLIRVMWPECPARIDDKGTGLFVDRATAVLTPEVAHARS